MTAASAGAESLAVKAFTPADGLAHDEVWMVTQDSRGFLWFGTPEGLSRFDGARFTTLSTGPGLPNPSATSLLESEGGGFWVGTRGGGVLHVSASGQPGRLYSIGQLPGQSRVLCLLRDRRGWVWAGTEGGLFVLRDARAEFTIVGRPSVSQPELRVHSLHEAGDGTLWWGTNDGLMSWREDAPVDEAAGRALGIEGVVWAVREDAEGRIWAGGSRGLWCFRPPAREGGDRPPPRCDVALERGSPVRLPGAPGEVCRYRTSSGAAYSVRALMRSADGTLWIGTEGQGLLSVGARGVSRYTTAPLLIDDTVWALYEDREGSIWAGTPRGARRLARDGFVGYEASDGLVDPHVVSLVRDGQGGVCALGTLGLLQCVRDGRVKALRLRVSADVSVVGWNQLLADDGRGAWWLRAPDGLYRFPAGDPLVALARPLQRFTKGEGHLPAERASRVFADSRGDVWLGVWHEGLETVVRRDSRTGRFEWLRVPEPFGPRRVPGAFGEDRTGTVWVGFFDGGLARHRRGRLELVEAPREVALIRHVRSFLSDRRGRLWFAAGQDGLGRIDDPAAEHPIVTRLGAKDGLASGDVRCVVEDGWGRLYVGTQRGVDRLDPATGSIRHYTSDDGLARGGVEVCLAAGSRLWFGTVSGLSSLAPGVEPRSANPEVFVERLSVAGAPLALSPIGEREVGPFELQYPGQVEVDYAAPGRGVRYQYRLEGGGDSDWSPPSESRSVNFASLASGSYRFLVRAVSADAHVSQAPASVSFRVVPPWWRRPWFLTLLAAGLASVAYSGHRLRLLRQLAVERVRTRIAKDLHDDVGSTVSRMAIMSEVVRRQVEGTHAEAAQALRDIAKSARELVDSTSDIVWAVDPHRDDVKSLAARVRGFGSGLFEAAGIFWEFEASPPAEAVKLDPEQRRELFLILKEALNNAVRHAGCSRVRVGIGLLAGGLSVEVSDDGKGMAAGTRRSHGLDSMQARAARLGGRLALDSAPGRGTRVSLLVPLRRRDA